MIMDTGFWFLEIGWRPLGDRVVSSGHPVYITGDIGINHNGELATALALIDRAADAGCDAVTFAQLDADAYPVIDQHAQCRGIAWFASAWDLAAVDFLEHFTIAAHVVESVRLADDQLLRRLRATGRTVLVSTGTSSLREVNHAVEVLGSHNVVLCHAASTSPAVANELNLRMLHTLQREFPDVPVGYSGQETGLQTTLAAVAMGAVFVKRRITLDRAMWGPDHAASIEPQTLQRLVHDIRVISDALGDGVDRAHDDGSDDEELLPVPGLYAEDITELMSVP
jgi:N-acetylneuraminate synthase